MEYGKILDDIENKEFIFQNDNRNYKFVLYDYTLQDPIADCEKFLFSKENILNMQKKLKQLLKGVHPEGKAIIVAPEVITNVVSGIFNNQVPVVGDIYSRYQVVDELSRNDVQEIINKSIQVIYDNIRNEFEMIENNNKLTIWTTVYGDFNKHGLRQHPPIKINNKRPDPMLFNMNY